MKVRLAMRGGSAASCCKDWMIWVLIRASGSASKCGRVSASCSRRSASGTFSFRLEIEITR